MVDTNSDPRDVDFVIPSNDDASKSIDKILSIISSSISEGLQERRNEKEEAAKAEKENINDNVKAEANESTDK
jgi:small subunit ribosomal protein S2